MATHKIEVKSISYGTDRSQLDMLLLVYVKLMVEHHLARLQVVQPATKFTWGRGS